MGYVLSAEHARLLEAFLAYQKPLVSEQGYTRLSNLAKNVLVWFDREEMLLQEATLHDALRYQAWLSEYRDEQGQPYAMGTVLNYLKAAKRLASYLVYTDVIQDNVFAALRNPREGVHISRNVLNEAQMLRLLSELSHFDSHPVWYDRLRSYRVHVIAEVLYATGLRIAEACSLTASHLDLEQRRVYLEHGKGGAPRTAFLTRYATEVLRQYLQRGREVVMKAYPREHSTTLFGASKARVAEVVNDELMRVCTRLGLPVITTHGFRHSLGTHLLRSGADMRHIQVILGHEALQTTQIYTRVDKDDLKRSLDQFHPRSWPAGTSAS